mgnify:CR=1 FL=1
MIDCLRDDDNKKKFILSELKKIESELISQNFELEKTLYKLKNMHTQLVISEKMASLGQITAGVAHEINNPINFIKGNYLFSCLFVFSHS